MKNELKIDHGKPVFANVWNHNGDKHKRIYLFSFGDRHYCVPVEKHDAYIGGEKVNAMVCWENIEFIKEKKQVIEPWTFEICPWPLSLNVIGNIRHQILFTSKRENGIMLNSIFYSWEDLIQGFTQLDGKPCGIVREVDA
jgi:hypothetical protein